MAYKTVNDLSADTTVSIGGVNRKTGKKNPTSVEGYYLGSREVADNKKKSGVSYIYFFQTAQGNVGVWGKTDMDRKLKTVTVGQMVRVSFDKMVKTPNGDMYKYNVEFDEKNTIEVAGANANDSDAGSYASEDDDEESEESDEDIDVSDDEVSAAAAQLAAATAAERAAKVAALLKKKAVK